MDWFGTHFWQVVAVVALVLLWRIASLLAELRRDVEEVYKTLWMLPGMHGRSERAKEMRAAGAFPELSRPKETPQ